MNELWQCYGRAARRSAYAAVCGNFRVGNTNMTNFCEYIARKEVRYARLPCGIALKNVEYMFNIGICIDTKSITFIPGILW